MNPYAIDPNAKHQWYHWTAAVKDFDDNVYGIQATHFHMNHGKTIFSHVAITDVKAGTHRRAEITTGAMMGRLHEFTIGDTYVGLMFLPEGPLQTYPSQTSQHFGYPRMDVMGRIGEKMVDGVGCYDREVFDKLLLPGETGWNWTILWYDDGEWDMQYRFRIGHSTEHYRIQIPTKDPRTPNIMVNCPVEGIWPKGEHTPVYYEHFILLKDEERKQIGTGFSEFTLIDL